MKLRNVNITVLTQDGMVTVNLNTICHASDMKSVIIDWIDRNMVASCYRGFKEVKPKKLEQEYNGNVYP